MSCCTSTMICPACERPVGQELCCPYCGVDVPHRKTVILLRLASVLSAVAGLGLLWSLAIHTPAPCLRVADIAPSMNHAYVGIRGTVVNHTDTSFDLDDGTGHLTVMVPKNGTGIPSAGAVLRATGTLYLVANRPARLYVTDTRHLNRLDEESP